MKRLIAVLALLPAAALAQTPQTDAAFHATTLSLSASGEVDAAPDMAEITLGVTGQAPTAAQAMADNARRMAAVIAALHQAGLADRDIQTVGLNLSAQRLYAQNQPPKLTGYQAANTVHVQVREVGRLGTVVDAAAQAGANQINSIAFELRDAQAAEDEARRRAVKALQAKAELYAQAAGYRVARLVSLSEGGGYQPSPLPRFALAAPADVSPPPPTPAAPGELTVRIDITGVYELAK